tara:strand:- start:712 stop:954 length:243 start_codon:yes stop_codon:yes gene_type:complete
MITLDELKTYQCDDIEEYFDKVLDAFKDGFKNQCRLMTSTMDKDQRNAFIDYIYELYHYEITSDENVIDEVRSLIKFLNL